MKSQLPVRIVLVAPPPGAVYGVQRGTGSKYEVDFAHLHERGDITFDFAITVSFDDKSGVPIFSGEFIQGRPARRFIYVDVGTYAGQKNTPWSRRMIVPLNDITAGQVRKAVRPGHRLRATIQGTGKDGGPSCATVPIVGGWQAELAQT